MGSALGVEKIAKVFVIPHVSALIRADTDRVSIFLDSGHDELFHAAIVADMNNFQTGLLKQASKNVNSRIVAIEER
jgi:hypothetical protein